MRIPEEDQYVHALQDMQAIHTLDVFEVIQQPGLSRIIRLGGKILESLRFQLFFINFSSGTCVSNAECADNEACKDYNCIDPCTTSCGRGADCRAQNHVAICRCPRGNTGDPFQVSVRIKNCYEFDEKNKVWF